MLFQGWLQAPSSSSVKTACRAGVSRSKQTWLAIGWHNTVPVRAKPDSRPCLEEGRYRNTRQAAHSYLTYFPGFLPKDN